MRRTTIAVEDALLGELRERAARERRSMSGLVNDLLRSALRAKPTASREDTVRWQTYRSGGAFVDVNDREALAAVMEEP